MQNTNELPPSLILTTIPKSGSSGNESIRKCDKSSHVIIQQTEHLHGIRSLKRTAMQMEAIEGSDANALARYSKDSIIFGELLTDDEYDVFSEADMSHDVDQESQDGVDHSKMVTGVIVNGFHPQLFTWHQNQINDNQKNKNENYNGTIIQEVKKSRLDKNIGDIVDSCRQNERQQVNNDLHGVHFDKFGGCTSMNDIFCDVFENSTTPQLIATPGGRFGAWNKEFLQVCGFAPTGPYASLTIFDLVMPSVLPQLHRIFLTALHEESPDDKACPKVDDGSNEDKEEEQNDKNTSDAGADDENNDDSSSSSKDVSYLSLTVPCIKFNKSQLSYFITLSLMYDINPDKRCFHCILTTKPDTSRIGQICHVKQNELMGML